MKMTIIEASMLLCCMLVGVKSDWGGSVQAVIDKTKLSTFDMKQVSASIFSAMDANCQYGMKILPSNKTTSERSKPCDQAEIEELKEGLKNAENFDLEAFLDRFTKSTAGLSMMNKYIERGVSESVFKAALNQTWGSKQSNEGMTTAFGRTFLNQGTQPHKANSWYSYSYYEQECREGKENSDMKDGVYIVEAQCGRSNMSSFIAPNPPYEDMVIYTLCAWGTNVDCMVDVPGRSNINIEVSLGINADGHIYLIGVHPIIKKRP